VSKAAEAESLEYRGREDSSAYLYDYELIQRLPQFSRESLSGLLTPPRIEVFENKNRQDNARFSAVV
jgi:hypothetical protein